MEIKIYKNEYKGNGRNKRIQQRAEFFEYFSKFCVVEYGNDAPRGGQIGEYAIFDTEKTLFFSDKKISKNMIKIYRYNNKNGKLLDVNPAFVSALLTYKCIKHGNEAHISQKAGEYAIFNTRVRFNPKSEDFKMVNSMMLPLKLLRILEKWEIINKSPYSNSFYNSREISWSNKPEGSLRLSDHWNFETFYDDSKHCRLAENKEYIKNNWILAIRQNGEYKIKKEMGALCG